MCGGGGVCVCVWGGGDGGSRTGEELCVLHEVCLVAAGLREGGI